MRFSAIIIDDEPGVCSLLRTLGEWERFSIDIVAVCHDGEEALQQIETQRPDIAITDIRMPGLDGLQLIEAARLRDIGTEFVILSGYGLFEYAQRAMAFGVNHYLLKPIDAYQLNQILQDICQNISLQRTAKLEKEENDHVIQEGKRSLHRDWLKEVLSGAVFQSAQAVNTAWKLELPETGTFYVIALSASQPALHKSNPAFFIKIQELFSQQFCDIGTVTMIQNPEGLFGLLRLEKPVSQKDLIDKINRLRGTIGALQAIFGSFCYAIALSKSADSTESLCGEVRRAAAVLRCRTICGGQNVLTQETCGKYLTLGRVKTWETDIQLSELEAYLEMHSAERIQNWFANCRAWFDKRGICTISMQEKLTKAVQNCIERSAEELGAIESFQSFYVSARDKLLYADGLKMFLRELEAFCLQFVEIVQQYKTDLEAAPIRKVKEYILEHLQYAITLEEVAEYANYSPAYFSTLFRKETGMNFKDYLLKVRLDRAKEYLKHTDESIVLISEKLGFGSDKYFRKVFKKETGVRAQEYRNLYR